MVRTIGILSSNAVNVSDFAKTIGKLNHIYNFLIRCLCKDKWDIKTWKFIRRHCLFLNGLLFGFVILFIIKKSISIFLITRKK